MDFVDHVSVVIKWCKYFKTLIHSLTIRGFNFVWHEEIWISLVKVFWHPAIIYSLHKPLQVICIIWCKLHDLDMFYVCGFGT